ncbi:MAG TPA: hypothetical protein VMB81_06110 [Candidatus Sulfotelmatobacter sp.]|nr:hypothetical protein [Candidatus Sulfotelmatobacter sp.]
MATRTSSKTVTFMRPFRLSAMEREQPAGSYTVETDEERLETHTLPAYRRLATFIRVPLRAGAPGSETIVIEPAELEAALARDAAPEQYGPETVGEHAARAGGRS